MDHLPTEEEMARWAQREELQRISLENQATEEVSIR